MIVLDCEQGTRKWKDAHIGIPTSSIFSQIATTKGVASDSQNKLLWKLVEEKFTGIKEDTYASADMRRGTKLEPEARIFFQMITGLDVTQVGMCFADEKKKYGCSPDGLPGEDEGLEIKCPSLKVHMEYLEAKKLPTAYFSQVQGSLYITGRERWHFFSYFPGIKPFHIVVERDEIWIAKFSKILASFIEELEATYKLLST